MRPRSFLIITLALLSIFVGHLLSKASWVTRVGMTFFYKEYNFLKIWWQGAIAVFVVWMLVMMAHSIIHRRFALPKARLISFLVLLLACAGLYATYTDFHNNLAHRLLGKRFHTGFYLFWGGWMIISLFYLFQKKVTATGPGSKDATVV
ncbi:MAG: cytochrome d ubiquinol oxidase subunit II [Taibaiella sp.]|nr:cytochrome d ubiquinol oxidase subunit II [Taibaiella sp.]